ncbi:amidohydrolase [Marinicauda algicola]|uniref:Amidohydrolase n=1 Tax=Marinicauda algicola TaxID=2029849 RepID=A0A4V3RYC8_9PROT|nr:amidohydrolase [Marinicauda algicola]TGY89949.1 amidohydrolase [Marinicauda algicola]
MRRLALAAVSALALAAPGLAQEGELRSAIEADYAAHLEGLYRHFHANPELSFVEGETAARLAAELREAGFEVTEGVGETGLVAVMENGEGPTVLLRADMDALPMEEDTGLEFASTVTQEDRSGNVFPVMHACAHDTHMTALVGAARWFSNNRDAWSGKLILIGQPAEEIGLGAYAMLNDGLYQRFGTPDAVVSFHTWGYIPAGQIRYAPEYAMANVDTVDIHVRGIGAHGASPQNGIDPIVLASQIVTNLQTLVSREISPFDTGVVTVGAFNAGTKHNIIPDSAHLQLTVRSYEPAVRQTLLDGIQRIARAQALAAGLPEELMPVVEIDEIYTPALYNDPDLSQQAGQVLRARFGDAVQTAQAVTGGEDFSRYGMTEEDVPIFMFWVGGQPHDVWDEYTARGETPPANHSPFFYPDAEASITMATEGLTAIALDILDNGVATGATE